MSILLVFIRLCFSTDVVLLGSTSRDFNLSDVHCFVIIRLCFSTEAVLL